MAADDSGNAVSNDAMQLEGEIGYGFAAFSGRAVITPYGGLYLSDSSRDRRLGGRLSFSSALDISIEGNRKEQPNEALDHSIRLDLNTAWQALGHYLVVVWFPSPRKADLFRGLLSGSRI